MHAAYMQTSVMIKYALRKTEGIINSALCFIQLQKLHTFDDKATPQLKTSRHSHQLSLWLQLTSSLPNAVSARAVELSVKEVG